jgi:hypothetical protein
LTEEGLIDSEDEWIGGSSVLCLVGDFVDRGPDGAGVIELVMRLEQEAVGAGGMVHTLLGNHDALLVAASRLSTRPSVGRGGTFRAVWENAGGKSDDLQRLSSEQIAWLASRPAIILLGDWLMVHADSQFYLRYGNTIEEVNQAIAEIMSGQSIESWDRLLIDFCDREAFTGLPGPARARNLLKTFGGMQIIHGHTPISYVTGVAPAEVPGPFVYSANHCINVDGGMCYGGPGFVARFGTRLAAAAD